MKKSILWSLVILIVAAALYRIIPNRPYGFAPQIAMALFGGAILKDRKWAFALPLFSMFVSDALYEVLYQNGLSSIRGFYDGMLLNYLVFGSVVLVGFLMKRITVTNILMGSLLAPTWFFLVSNFTVWLGNASIAQTWSGLMTTYALGIPFYKTSIIATLLFSGIFFGVWAYASRTRIALTGR